MSLFNRKKKRNTRTLQNPINFARVYSIFFMVFFAWMVAAIFYLSWLGQPYNFQSFVIMVFPLPCFLMLLVYLVEKNDQITFNNIEVQKELDRIKDLHDARKKAGDIFDHSG